VFRTYPRAATAPLCSTLGCTPIATGLHENVEDVAGLVDCTPEVLPLTPDRHKKFIQVPVVAQATFSPLELSSVLRTKLPRPLSDGLAGGNDAAVSQESSTSQKLRQNR